MGLPLQSHLTDPHLEPDRAEASTGAVQCRSFRAVAPQKTRLATLTLFLFRYHHYEGKEAQDDVRAQFAHLV